MFCTLGASLQSADSLGSSPAPPRGGRRLLLELGESIGYYCVRVTFVDPTDVRGECKADLQDGDTKTVRVVGPNLAPGAVVKVLVRLGAVDERRDVVAPG